MGNRGGTHAIAALWPEFNRLGMNGVSMGDAETHPAFGFVFGPAGASYARDRDPNGSIGSRQRTFGQRCDFEKDIARSFALLCRH